MQQAKLSPNNQNAKKKKSPFTRDLNKKPPISHDTGSAQVRFIRFKFAGPKSRGFSIIKVGILSLLGGGEKNSRR